MFGDEEIKKRDTGMANTSGQDWGVPEGRTFALDPARVASGDRDRKSTPISLVGDVEFPHFAKKFPPRPTHLGVGVDSTPRGPATLAGKG